MTATRPGKALAAELQAESRSGAPHTPMARLIETAASHALTEDHDFRLMGQLGVMQRMSPRPIDDLFTKQLNDASTRETLYGHAILQPGWV